MVSYEHFLKEFFQKIQLPIIIFFNYLIIQRYSTFSPQKEAQSSV